MTEIQSNDLASGMGKLKESLQPLIDIIPENRPIIYLDNPVHLNIGDLLINKGTEELLAASNRKILHRFCIHNYQKFMPLIEEHHILVLHGGGNLGDVWHSHEKMRQAILKQFPRNKIIVFPQTVHFKNETLVEHYAQAYRQHPDCTLFLRDKISYEFVKEKFRVPCHLSPDTAHFLWQTPLFPYHPEGNKDLLFLREDIESTASDKLHPSIDWDTILSTPDYVIFKCLELGLRFCRTEKHNSFLINLWYKHRDRMIKKSANYFGNYATIATDRLHGLILGCLLGKAVKMQDNNYGKLSSYCDTWLHWIEK